MSRWDLREQPSHTVEVLTDPCVNLVFEKDCSRVVGVHTRLFRRELVGQGLLRAVKLRAGAARALLKATPIASLAERMVPLESVFGSEVRALEARVLADDHEARELEAFALFEQWLEAQLQRPFASELLLAVKLLERIASDPTLITVAEVVRVSGLSLRPLQRLFRDYVGVTPKWALRRFRLQEAAVRIERGGLRSLATLAAELGYTDHAHLTRDFRAATGRAPSAFAKDVWR